MWEEISDDKLESNGSVCILQKDLYLVGGSTTTPFLGVKKLNLTKASWFPVVVNTIGILNRQRHASAVAMNKIYVFGGSLTATLSPAPEVLEITPGQFGCNISTLITHPDLARQGHSATTIGTKQNFVVIFGGEGTTAANTLLFNADTNSTDEHGHEGPSLKKLETVGEVPPPRSYHSASVCGSELQNVVVFGGIGKGDLFNDVWILDLHSIVKEPEVATTTLTAVPAKAKDKAKPPPGGDPKSVSVVWTKLVQSSNILPRYLHSSFVCTIREQVNFCVFGGIGRQEDFGSDVWGAQIVKNESGQASIKEFAVVETFMLDGAVSVLPSNTIVSGSAVAAFFGEYSPSSDPIAIIAASFGPRRSAAMLVLHDDDPSINDIRDAISVNACGSCRNPLPEAIPSHMVYENEDEYWGEMVVASGGASRYLRHGVGKMVYIDGEIYEGSWELDVRKGEGSLQQPDGTKYEGGFNDVFSGFGTLSTPDGNTYSGDFFDGAFHGQGKLTDCKNVVYEGFFENGAKQGVGSLKWLSPLHKGDAVAVTISGDWANNALQEGLATNLPINLDGKWEAQSAQNKAAVGIYTGRLGKLGPHDLNGECKFFDASTYVGSWRSGRRNGMGKWKGSAMDEYEGKWVANKRCGHGVWKSSRRESYDGLWEDDKPHGFGIRTFADGSTYAGEFVRGLRKDGEGVDFVQMGI